jgi:RNA polymerase sigma-70 factor (ECF subfamily)
LSVPDARLQTYLTHRGELVDYAARITGDRSRAEDVVQEAFIRFAPAMSDRDLEEPVGYLRRIIRNLALDVVRRLSSERRHISEDAAAEAIAEDRPSQEDVLAHQDELRIVMAAMAELPPRTRRALEMHRFDGAKLKDIAAQLGISVALAHSLVHDGLDHCRKSLKVGSPRKKF